MQSLTSSIYTGSVRHVRVTPKRHAFDYSVYFYGLWLDELPDVASRTTGLAYNRWSVASIHDRDYLTAGDPPVSEKLNELIAGRSGLEQPKRVYWLTTARYFNYTFNPVSFYLLFREGEELYGLVAEVNNTFGDRHLYFVALHPDREGVWKGEADKAFHVSPFYDMSGSYDFIVHRNGKELAVDVNLVKEDGPSLHARLEGVPRPLSTASLWSTLATYPLSASLTFSRITAQALRLKFQKKLPVFRRPEPNHPDTLKSRQPRRRDTLFRDQIFTILARAQTGRLEWVDADGSSHHFGSHTAKTTCLLRVRTFSFYRKLALEGGIAFGEAYMAGDLELSDPVDVVEFLIHNRSHFEAEGQTGTLRGKLGNWILHLLRRNSVRNSRKNIQAHYDLSNDFFSLFLDSTLSYSCGLYRSADDSLEQAQKNKMHALIQKARIRPEHHVLEIGTGWGALAMEMVRQTGCRVTSITVSNEQMRLARKRIREAGMQDSIRVELCDYRDVKGSYDRIISVEMIEAVGHQYFPTFFRCCEERLAPNGLLVMQAITISDQKYEAYRKGCDFIQKHIFPGGHLPSLNSIGRALEKQTNLHILDLDNIGPHYAPTLRAWRERVEANREAIQELGFDDVFFRKWIYYLCYCEAAFATGTLDVLHLMMSRAENPDLLSHAIPGSDRPSASLPTELNQLEVS